MRSPAAEAPGPRPGRAPARRRPGRWAAAERRSRASFLAPRLRGCSRLGGFVLLRASEFAVVALQRQPSSAAAPRIAMVLSDGFAYGRPRPRTAPPAARTTPG